MSDETNSDSELDKIGHTVVKDGEIGAGTALAGTALVGGWKMRNLWTNYSRGRKIKNLDQRLKAVEANRANGGNAGGAPEIELTAAQQRLQDAFHYDPTSKFRFSPAEGGATAETEYLKVLGQLRQNAGIAKGGDVHLSDIEKSIAQSHNRAFENYSATEQAAIKTRAEAMLGRMQNEGIINAANSSGEYAIQAPQGILGRTFSPRPAPDPVFSSAQQENALYRKVLNIARADPDAAANGIDSGNIHDFIRRAEDGDDYLARGLQNDPNHVAHDAQAQRFLKRMQEKGNLGTQAGQDGKFALQADKPLSFTEGVKARLPWNKPPALKNALTEAAELRAAENPGFFGKLGDALNFTKNPNIAKSVARSESGLGLEATTSELKLAAPEIMESAGGSLLRNVASTAMWPLTIGMSAWEMYPAIKTGDKKTIASAAGSTGGALVGALAGAAIGSIVPVAGTAVGFVAGAALGWAGSKLGQWGAEKVFGKPLLAQQDGRMQFYLDASGKDFNKGSDLDKLAIADGFKNGIGEAHWAAQNGFDGSATQGLGASGEMHLVEQAAGNWHAKSTDAYLDTVFQQLKAAGQVPAGITDRHQVADFGSMIAAGLKAHPELMSPAASAPSPGAGSGSGAGSSYGGGDGMGSGSGAQVDYSLSSARNFGAQGAAATAALQAMLAQTDPKTGKAYLPATGASDADTINATEHFLHDKGYYDGPMDDGQMGKGVRAGLRAWAKDNGVDLGAGGGVLDATANTALLATMQKVTAANAPPPAPTPAPTPPADAQTANANNDPSKMPQGEADQFFDNMQKSLPQAAQPQGPVNVSAQASIDIQPVSAQFDAAPHKGDHKGKLGRFFGGLGHGIENVAGAIYFGQPAGSYPAGSYYSTYTLIPGRVPHGPPAPASNYGGTYGMGTYTGNGNGNRGALRNQTAAAQQQAANPHAPITASSEMTADQWQVFEQGQKAGTTAAGIQPGYAKPFNDDMHAMMAKMTDEQKAYFNAGYHDTFSKTDAGKRADQANKDEFASYQKDHDQSFGIKNFLKNGLGGPST